MKRTLARRLMPALVGSGVGWHVMVTVLGW